MAKAAAAVSAVLKLKKVKVAKKRDPVTGESAWHLRGFQLILILVKVFKELIQK